MCIFLSQESGVYNIFTVVLYIRFVIGMCFQGLFLIFISFPLVYITVSIHNTNKYIILHYVATSIHNTIDSSKTFACYIFY